MRHFLVARDAVFAGGFGHKKVWLSERKYKQIVHAGGMFVGSDYHIATLRATGLMEVVINTGKGGRPVRERVGGAGDCTGD